MNIYIKKKDNIIKLLNLIMPIILLKDLNWYNYDPIWEIIIKNTQYIEKYENLIIDNKIYTKWSENIYYILISTNNTILYNILNKNICNELSHDIWSSIFTFNKDSVLTTLIIDNNICDTWPSSIWKIIINKKLFNQFIDKIIEYKIYEKWELDTWNLIKSNKLLDLIMSKLNNDEIKNLHI